MSATTYTVGEFDNNDNLLKAYHLPFCKFDATTAPGAGNDDTQGYIAGSLWVDRTNHKVYVCSNSASSAAVWVQVVAGGGSGVSIGDPIGSGTAHYVLFVDGSGNLGQDGNLTWNAGGTLTVNNGGTYSVICGAGPTVQALYNAGTYAAYLANSTYGGAFTGTGGFVVYLCNATEAVNATDSTRTVRLCDGTQAGHFTDGTRTVNICDGTNNVTYTPGASGNWSGSPTDVWVALDRLAAAVAGLLGGAIP